MLRFRLILVIVTILIIGAGCSKATSQSTQAGKLPVQFATQATGTGSSSPGAQIIAKSGSSVSNQDKEAILNQIDTELNNMVQTVNNLEDVNDSELNL